MNFITDTDCEQARKLLLKHKFSLMKLQHPDGHQLACFPPPRQGWTPYDLWQMRQQFPLNGKTQRFLLTYAIRL